MGGLGEHWADCTFPDNHCACEFGLFAVRAEAARIARADALNPTKETT